MPTWLAPWSPRLAEAIVFGCIPVIIADDIVLPFANAIPWEEISMFVDEEDVLKLPDHAHIYTLESNAKRQRLLAYPSMEQAMLIPQPAQPSDVFH